MNNDTNQKSNFLSTFTKPAVLGLLFGALCGSDPVNAQTPFQLQTGSCGGCSTCLSIGTLSATPVRLSNSCNTPAGCGGTQARFADMTSYRGLLQVVSTSSNSGSCPQSLHSTAQWNAVGTSAGTDVFFTGPAGQTSVLTRARYVMSNISTGDTSVRLRARLHGMWANDTLLPTNVTDFHVFSPWTAIGLNVWRTHDVGITSVIINGSTCFMLHLPLNEPVFELPPGYTANSPTLGIVDNIWHGLDIEGDWNASTGGVGCFNSLSLIHSVTGSLTVENTSVTEIDLGSATQIGGDVTVINNGSVREIDLGSATQIGGNVTVIDNTSATTVDFGTVGSVGGDVTVTENPSAASVDFGTVGSVGGDVTVADTGTSGASNLIGSDIPLTINFGSLTTVDGSLNISANSKDTTVLLGPLSTINGALTLETKVAPLGGGTMNLSNVAVSGNIVITAKDADAVLIRTPNRGSSAAATIARDDSDLTATLPANTFNDNTILTAQRIDPNTLAVVNGLDAEGQPIRIDPVNAHHLDANGAMLLQDATIAVEVKVSGLSPSEQSKFLTAVADGRVTLVSKGDGPQDQYQAFELCDANTPPSAGGCATMELLDADHAPLPPDTLDPPAFVRFVCKTSHFSTFAAAIRVRVGDLDGDGVVNVSDLLAVINAWGPCAGTCPPACAADVNFDCTVNVSDLLSVINNWG